MTTPITPGTLEHRWAAAMVDLPDPVRNIAGAVLRLLAKGERAPTYERLGEEAGVSGNTAAKHIRWLERHGWLTRIRTAGGPGVGNEIVLREPPKSATTNTTRQQRRLNERIAAKAKASHFGSTGAATAADAAYAAPYPWPARPIRVWRLTHPHPGPWLVPIDGRHVEISAGTRGAIADARWAAGRLEVDAAARALIDRGQLEIGDMFVVGSYIVAVKTASADGTYYAGVDLADSMDFSVLAGEAPIGALLDELDRYMQAHREDRTPTIDPTNDDHVGRWVAAVDELLSREHRLRDTALAVARLVVAGNDTPTYQQIATAIGVKSPETARDYIGSLEYDRWICRMPNPGPHGSIITLLEPPTEGTTL